jgi:8-oxo-dGTP diphosphatase
VRAGSGGPEVLLQLRGAGTTYMAGHWATAAAGHVEAGESVFEAAVREAREELGITVATEHLTSLCAMHRTEPGNPAPIEQRVDFFLLTQDWVGEPTVQEPDKCADLGWFPLDGLPEPMVPHELSVLEQIRAGTLPPVVTFGFDPPDPPRPAVATSLFGV